MTELHLILREVRSEIAAKEGHLSRNGAKDFGDYRYRCGMIWSLRHIESYIEQRIKNGEQE